MALAAVDKRSVLTQLLSGATEIKQIARLVFLMSQVSGKCDGNVLYADHLKGVDGDVSDIVVVGKHAQ